MKPKLPWWHSLLRPYFNMRADAKDRRDAAARLTAEHLVGYFHWTHPGAGVSVMRAMENGAGKRRVEWIQGGEYAHICGQAVVTAWLSGDDSAYGAIHADLTTIPGLLSYPKPATRKSTRR